MTDLDSDHLTERSSQQDPAQQPAPQHDPRHQDSRADRVPRVDPTQQPSGAEEDAPGQDEPTFGEGPTRSGFVAIVGKPNVGKSTLLNTLLGVKVAPITPKPQTTRKGVRGIYTHERAQIVFVDTPGLHQGRTVLDEFMMREIHAALADVEAILWVVDLRRPPNAEDKSVARLLQGMDPDTPVYLIGNKLDAAKYPDEALGLYRDLLPDVDHVRPLSALNDPEAVYALRDELIDLAEEGPFFFPAEVRSDQSRSEWTSELIRESVMIHLRQELPYSVAVQVVEWDESASEDEPHYIAAEIWVERQNHRGMVIGKGGRMIKEIGQTARKQLEVFLSHQIFLDLEVVVRSDWRADPEALRELGYQS